MKCGAKLGLGGSVVLNYGWVKCGARLGLGEVWC